MGTAIVHVWHKSNSFSRQPTLISDFHSYHYWRRSSQIDTQSECPARLAQLSDAVSTLGHTPLPLFSAASLPGGELDDGTLEQIIDDMKHELSRLEIKPSRVLLDAPGSLVSSSIEDPLSEMLNAIRSVLPESRIILLISPVTNLTNDSIERCASVVVDDNSSPLNTSVRRGFENNPVLLGQLPILSATAMIGRDLKSQLSASPGNSDDQITSLPAGLTLLSGNPFADRAWSGVQLLMSADSTSESQAQEIVDNLWRFRSRFNPAATNVEEAVHTAMDATDDRSLLIDLGDSIDNGAPGNGTTLLWALIDLGVRDAVVAPIIDAEATAIALNAGLGNVVEFSIGGKKDHRQGYPIDVRGRVKRIFNLPPMTWSTSPVSTRGVLFEAEARHGGHVDIVLLEHRRMVDSSALLQKCGVLLHEKQIVSLKSAATFRSSFPHDEYTIYDIVTPGISTPDLAFFEYRNIRKPTYPLDSEVQ